MRERTTLSILFFLLAIAVSAQPDSLRIPSMQEVYRQNSWLAASNPIGLSFNHFHTFSIAEAGYSYQKGNLGNVNFPTSANVYSIYSESFQKLGKVALYGKLRYANKQKQNINWNGMTGDYWRGINLCDSVNGNQSSEQYQLAGAFSMPISAHWLLGTQFDYLVELTVKDTDPRNKNQWMEWKLTPGAGYQNHHIRLGASLIYTNRKERIDYQNVGIHAAYPFLIAYPLGFFKTLPRDENINWHYNANEIGGALQAENTFGHFRLFQEISGSTTKQAIISKRIQNKKEGETELWEIKYKGKLQRSSLHNRHEWSWHATFNGSDSYDPLQQQEESGTWTSHGKVLRSTKNSSEYSLVYGYYQLRDSWNSRFSLVSGIKYNEAEHTLFFYPKEYTQPVHRFTIHATATRNFLLRDGWIDCAIGGQYGKGGGDIIKETLSQPGENEPDIKLWKNQDRLEQDFNSITEPRWTAHLSVTYTHNSPAQWFIRLLGEYEEVNRNSYNGNKKHISLQFGLLF